MASLLFYVVCENRIHRIFKSQRSQARRYKNPTDINLGKLDVMTFNSNDKKILLELVKNQEKSLLDIKKHLIKLKNKDVSQDELYLFLENLRSDIKTESEEDYILEIMDLVCGWCSLDLQIYPPKSHL